MEKGYDLLLPFPLKMWTLIPSLSKMNTGGGECVMSRSFCDVFCFLLLFVLKYKSFSSLNLLLSLTSCHVSGFWITNLLDCKIRHLLIASREDN